MSRKKKEDVVEELVQIKSRLQNFSICIKDTKEIVSEKYLEQVESYKEVINNDYKKINESKKQFYTLDRNAEYDARSLAIIKLLNSRKVYEVTDLQNIFVTSNSSLVEIFCNEYKKCISPVMKDTVIGLSVCVTNEKTYDKFMEMQLISYCNHIYKPNAETKEKYIQIIDFKFFISKI